MCPKVGITGSYCIAFRRICWQTTEQNLSVDSSSRYGPPWVRNIWWLWPTICKLTDMWKNLINWLSSEGHTMWYSTKKPRSPEIHVQPLAYPCNAQMHPFTSWTSFSLVLPRHHPDPATFDARMAFPTDGTVSSSPCILWTLFLHLLAAFQQDGDKQMNTSKRRYRGSNDRKIRNVPNIFYPEHYLYLDRALMANSVTERLATDSHRKLFSRKLCQLRIVKVHQLQYPLLKVEL